uniref:Uncharacterized protein n=1 Tax=Octopus bimaculoides TaxID=37653 RepID=A0A0L8GNG6_OCTBM
MLFLRSLLHSVLRSLLHSAQNTSSILPRNHIPAVLISFCPCLCSRSHIHI